MSGVDEAKVLTNCLKALEGLTRVLRDYTAGQQLSPHTRLVLEAVGHELLQLSRRGRDGHWDGGRG